jgi:hypothetical protein
MYQVWRSRFGKYTQQQESIFNQLVSDIANNIKFYFDWKLIRLVAPDNTLFRYILQELAFCVNNLSILADFWSPKSLLYACKSMSMDNNCAGQ